ncbi:RagB/SusD family nutrient uptake outer membrane protein [Polaribacter sp. AHE13PA]|uniref:RagB/SusD family nutrient uptake outer membrane protein n=1 Tax=Polaribacter sp. AHE13PA TaxID=2745562 RepID=UPI001C4F27A4|nr:RagB/SusD family nutrient uptake outer membrane protein [Polaribacter sp. AHE13PA]QXP66358.1 RagB/SusD family nutrient uptake outer membrane protein [Polaribacter sp. AHE13PA]
MRKIKYTFALIMTVFIISCEDYLDQSEEAEGLTENAIFNDIVLTRDFFDGAFTYYLSEVSVVNQSPDILPGMTMSGEGYPGRTASPVPETYQFYAQGDYLSLMNRTSGSDTTPNFVSRYFFCFKGIRIVNTFLENADNIPNSTEEEINYLKGQAYFLRASFYHLLTKRHGGLIYLKETLSVSQPLTSKRESYESNLSDMLDDIELAIDLLPVSWSTESVGRPTRGVAMALKSRLTLFAASPLANETNDDQKWIDAATAASDLINFANANGLYTLANASAASTLDVDRDGADLLVAEPTALQPYRNIFVGSGIQKIIPSEVIFMEANQKFFTYGGILNPTPRLSLTVGFDIIKFNNNPMNIGALANFIEKFETKNGLAIEDDPSYNPQDPFINRDPRFYNNILFDGVPWTTTTAGPKNDTPFVDLAVINEEGNYGKDLDDPSRTTSPLIVYNLTGLRIRKWIPNGAYWRTGNAGNFSYHVNNIIYRMPEVYLNYAEAVNEVYGPNGVAPGGTLTAVGAINLLRNRVGMPNVAAKYTGSKEDFRERIRNERAIELCFEGFRYDDLRRWKTAHLEENKKVEFLKMRWQGGKSATYPSGFSYENEEQTQLRKTFNDNNYWWPIPPSEIEAVPSFEQTEGW